MRSGHSVPCRYSSRAARDTKHWPQAKTNCNGLHSPRNAFYPGLTPRRDGSVHRARYRRRRCGPRSVLLTMRIDSCLISFALSREVPASLLGKLGQRATASRRIRDGRTVREGVQGANEGKTKKRQRGTKVCTIRAGGISILIESASFGRLFSSAEQRMYVDVSICSLAKALTGLRASSFR